MLFGALAGALLLGGYKYYSNRSFVSEKNYEDDYRVMASLMVEEYSGESAAERVGTVITVAESRSTYEKMKQLSGYDMEYLAYQDMFDLEREYFLGCDDSACQISENLWDILTGK